MGFQAGFWNVARAYRSGCRNQLGPNAVGVSRGSGLPIGWNVVGANPHACASTMASDDLLTELPLGEWIAERHGHLTGWSTVPICTPLYSDGPRPPVELATGCSVERFTSVGGVVQARTDNGEIHEGSVLIGADGLWSAVRRQLWPAWKLRYSGKTAARAVIDSAQAAAPFDESATGVWLAPGGHIVHYPVRGGREIALVVVLDDDCPGEGWGLPLIAKGCSSRFRIFRPGSSASWLRPEWRRWRFRSGASPRWSSGRDLIGDAAHPVLPFLAQGGALAIRTRKRSPPPCRSGDLSPRWQSNVMNVYAVPARFVCSALRAGTVGSITCRSRHRCREIWLCASCPVVV